MEYYADFINRSLPEPYLAMHYLTANRMLDYHTHDFYQVIIVTGGALEIKTDAGTELLYEGNVHILPRGCAHALASADGYSQLGIDVAVDIANERYRPFFDAFCEPTTLMLPWLLKHIKTICQHNLNKSAVFPYIAVACLDLILFETVDKKLAETVSPLARQLDERLDALVSSGDADRVLQRAAEALFVSCSHLERICRQYYKSGVAALYNRKRFEKSCLYLITTDMSIGEVAELVGFSAPSNFTNFFKRYSGVPPLVYRKRYSAAGY